MCEEREASARDPVETRETNPSDELGCFTLHGVGTISAVLVEGNINANKY